ncbi:hypothetical protein AJ79_04924 [Helicocarpus griseus UAMH5409]|uniref:Carrier domain-containing protein n=1 Tax=Helicocarpus griseus UAMH5409 TaxID=1447875 RepID=A0A2B7XRT6_9EURO|nr:hypothetical protein AJ79_04924 [Helicocarpus griseus UAMH5409]
MPEDSSSLPMAREHKITFKPNVTYLLVGGLGGIGRAVSIWMIENGARYLAFLSRSAGVSAEDKAFIESLEFQGCNVIVEAGSIANMDDLLRLIGKCQAPIAGVLHMSMVLRAKLFFQSSHEDWAAVHAPKVAGVWNLHNALDSSKIDFFVVFSSIASLCGNKGQANYSAANSFLDAFVRYRRSQGLPASVLNLGMVGDIGCITKAPEVLSAARKAGVRLLNEREVLYALQVAIANSITGSSTAAEMNGEGQIIVGMNSTRPLSDLSVRCLWPDDARYGLYQHIEPEVIKDMDDDGCPYGDLKRYLDEAKSDPTKLKEKDFRELLMQETAGIVTGRSPEGASMAEISRITVDSLMLIEVGGWMRRQLKIDVNLATILGVKTVGELTEGLIDQLLEKYYLRESSNDH